MTEKELNNYRNIINDPKKLSLEIDGLVTRMITNGDDIPDIQRTNCAGVKCQSCPSRVKCVSKN